MIDFLKQRWSSIPQELKYGGGLRPKALPPHFHSTGTRPRDRNSSGSVVANTSVVLPIVGFTDNASKSVQSVEKRVNPFVVWNNALVESGTDLYGMQSIWRHFVDNQISPSVANVIIQS